MLGIQFHGFHVAHAGGLAVQEGADHSGPPPDLSVQLLDHIVTADLWPVFP